MPPREESEPQYRKRTRTLKIARSAGALKPPVNRQKNSQRSRTPPEFWDNLSRVPLCRRAVREFNRRTIRPVALEPLARSVLKEDLVKQLKRFARHGGPNLCDIRGVGYVYAIEYHANSSQYPALQTEAVRTMSSSQSRPSRSRPSRSRIGTGTDPPGAPSQSIRKTTLISKDPAFEQALIDVGIYPYGYQYSDDDETPIPNNIEEINERLGQPRPSLSPSHFTTRDFRNFGMANVRAKTKDVVRCDVLHVIRDRPAILSGQSEKFNNLKLLASNISSAQPDYYDGSRPADLNMRVRNDLTQYISPCTNTATPLLLNHFTEIEGPKGDAAEMKLRLTQDLGNGARGMSKAQSYGQDGYTYDGNAYTLGSTYHSGTGTLQLYAMHPTQPADPSGQPQYHMTQLNSFGMTGNAETFRQGATWYRNSRDLAKEWRDSAIAQANATAIAQASVTANAKYKEASKTSSRAAYESQSQETITSQDDINQMVQDDTDTSLDELAFDYNQSRKRPKPRQSRSRKRARTSSSASRSATTE